MQKTSASIILVAAGLTVVMSALVFSSLTANQRITSTGNVKGVGVGVYSDSGCTQKISVIDWGALNPGETKTYNVYVRNDGNVNMTLSMTTENWNPSATSSYISLTWNRQGYRLNIGASVQAVLTLSVSSSITGIQNFGFDIVVTGTETS